MTRVAVQGEPGCFSHAAALSVFGEVDLVPCRDFQALFEAVESGRADRGAVPVENALAGAVTQTLDLLLRNELRATHEAYVRVELCLVVPEGRDIGDIRSAASHPVALQQCHTFFEKHPDVRPVAAYDTAGSIRDLLADDAPTYDAAIGPALAANLYGGTILERGIEDHHLNFTRFLMVTRDRVGAATQGGGGADPVTREGVGKADADVSAETSRPGDAVSARPRLKTSLAFALPHRPGSLHAALGVFAEHEVDLTRLESRPIPGHPWEYRFFADLRGGSNDARERAIAALREMAPEVHVFGTYEEVDPP